MRFLTNWTIDLAKVPAYTEFKQDFGEHIDYELAKLILATDDKRITDDMKTEFGKLLEKVDRETNILPVKYNPRYGLGRRYASYPDEKLPNGLPNPAFKKYYSALISQPRIIKNTLFKYSNWVDIDQVKGHATIIMDMATKNNISLPSYEDYLKSGRFGEIVTELSAYYSVEGEAPIDKKDIKLLFNKTIYGGGHAKWCEGIQAGKFSIDENDEVEFARVPKKMNNADSPHPIYKAFHADTKKIIELVYLNNEDICKKVCTNIAGGQECDWRRKNRVMSYFCGIIENEITFRAYKYLLKENIIQKGLLDWGLDGITFPNPENIALDEILAEMNDAVRKVCGFKTVSFIVKAFEDDEILEDLITKRNEISKEDDCGIMDDEPKRSDKKDWAQYNELQKEIKDDDFKTVADKFELSHCKILNKSYFVRETKDDIIIMSKPHIITAYENIIYKKPTDTKDGLIAVDTNFIFDWLRNNPVQRCYEDIDCFPDKSKCPENYFNTWKPFAMENITEYTEKPDDLRIIQQHILILCGNDQAVATYFEAWIAQMIQFPAVKSNCPTFISKEGAGKGTLMRLLEKMLGISKVFETATPSRDVWGDFNGRMASTFLVNLNELSKRETNESEGRIKALITDPRLTISSKGTNQYDINSYHRFMICTNKEEPFNSSRDDRRNWVVRSSDEKCGDKEYFTKLYELLEDENVIKTCYEYFKNIKGMEAFNKIPMVITEYQGELQTMSVSPLENWIKSFVMDNYNESSVEIMDKEQFNMFKKWCKDCSLEYNITSLQFGVRIKRLNIKGIEFGKHTKKGNTKIFNIDTLKKYFNIENLVVEDVEEILDEE